MEATTYNIPTSNMPRLTKAINKINRVCKKLGLPEWTVEVGEAYEFMDKSPENRGKMSRTPVTLTGETPKLEGWVFLGRIENLANSDVQVLMPAPGHEIPVEMTKDRHHCDHCDKNRYRKSTFIVEKDGEMRRVGSSCLKDFLGFHLSPETLGRFYTYIFELRAIEDINSATWTPTYHVQEILKKAAATIRLDGYHKANTGGASSADTVRYLFSKELSREDELRYRATDADNAVASQTIEWIRDLEGENNYEHNLKAFVEAGFVEWKHFGILVSAVASYLKAEEIKREREEKSNEHLGEVGKRSDFTVKSVSSRAIGPGYTYNSTRYLNRLEDEAGNLIVWFSERDFFDMIENHEDPVKIRATVKKHDIYRDRKQTVVNRVKIL